MSKISVDGTHQMDVAFHRLQSRTLPFLPMKIFKIDGFRGSGLALMLCLGMGLSVVTAIAQKSTKSPSSTKPEASPTATPVRPREIVILLNDARAASPELAVDTFLRVLEAKKITDPVWRKDIIDETQRMIADVQHDMPMRLSLGMPNELNDTEAYLRAAVSRHKLDRLSFQSRLVLILVETDPQRARQMVFQIGGNFSIKPRTCEDVLTYVTDDMYSAVGKVAATSFTQREIAEGQRALFVLPWIENIESPTQIRPVLSMVKTMKGPPAEGQMLFNAISRSIDRNFKDDRSFTNSLKWDDLAARINGLISTNAEAANAGLVAAYRSMLLKNLRSGRCTENAIEKDRELPDYIEAANKIFLDKPLTVDDITTSEVIGAAKPVHFYEKSSVARSVREEGRAAMGLKVVDNKIVKHDPNDIEWISRVNGFVDKMLALEGSDGETETELLMFKNAFLSALLQQALDPGELRRAIFRRYLQLIVRSSLQKTDVAQWLFWIRGAEAIAPDDFAAIAPEIPNQNIRVLLAMKKLDIGDDKKSSEQSAK